MIDFGSTKPLLLTLDPKPNSSINGYVLDLARRNAYLPVWVMKDPIWDRTLPFKDRHQKYLAARARRPVSLIQSLGYRTVKGTYEVWMGKVRIGTNFIQTYRPRLCQACWTQERKLHRTLECVGVAACPDHGLRPQKACPCGRHYTWRDLLTDECLDCNRNVTASLTVEPASEDEINFARAVQVISEQGLTTFGFKYPNFNALLDLLNTLSGYSGVEYANKDSKGRSHELYRERMTVGWSMLRSPDFDPLRFEEDVHCQRYLRQLYGRPRFPR